MVSTIIKSENHWRNLKTANVMISPMQPQEDSLTMRVEVFSLDLMAPLPQRFAEFSITPLTNTAISGLIHEDTSGQSQSSWHLAPV